MDQRKKYTVRGTGSMHYEIEVHAFNIEQALRKARAMHFNGWTAASKHEFHVGSASETEPENSHWDEDDDFPVCDWQVEVSNDDTRQSYADWVVSQREAQEECDRGEG